jgi:predicted acetylornithine/succinylornithine family transaminase
MSKKEDIVALYDKYVMKTYSQSLVLVKGKGTKVWDADGKVYLDFMAGISVCNVGHCHPHVVESIRNQAGTLIHVSNMFFNENQAKLAERLSSIALHGKCFFCNSGAEANEGLVKLARLWGHEKGKYQVITMKNSFHGRTLATAAATGQDKIQKGFEPMPDGFSLYAEYNNLESVASLVNEKTVAVLLEALQGEGGIIPATDEFMKGVRKLCDEKGLLMLCDEVQCGMGRTGNWCAFQGSGVDPDAFSMAKSLGSGYPIGAVVSNRKLGDVFQPGKHASTFGGTPLACAAALATIEVMEMEGLVKKASRSGDLFKEGLEAFAEKYEHIKEVRGRGLMIGVEFDVPVKPVVEKLMDMGLLTLTAGEKVLRFLPPLNVTDNELEEALDILNDCFAEMHGVKTDEEDEVSVEPATAAAGAVEQKE